MDLDAPLLTTEFVVVDTETNGKSGDLCEVTEVGAVLVGGGELHDRFESVLQVRAPLTRGIQRFTGITQAMVDEAPAADLVLPDLAELLDGRVLVAHSASFDVRVLKQAFARADLEWPAPPVLCTVALARRFAPLARQRKLRPLAEGLGIDVEVSHRALADAETCARVLCALFPRLCAHAQTVGEALQVLKPSRPSRARAGRTDGGRKVGGARVRRPDMAGVPDEPGVYLFRNAAGQVLYVGKSVALRTRARAHFLPSADEGDWITQVEMVDHEVTRSEVGALLREQRLIRELRPPGNVRGKRDDDFVYLRARLDIPFPVLEVAPEPAAGRAINIGPLRGRHLAVELMEQLNSLFGLRHCGRTMKRREWPSAYGQMGRCLSPCLHDLDPNLYRRRLDEALGLFLGDGAGAQRVLDHVTGEMRRAAEAQQFERAGWLRRRRERLATLFDRLGPTTEATVARPRLVLALHPRGAGADALWLAGGRVVDWGPADDLDDVVARTAAAVRWAGPVRGGAAHALSGDEVAEARVVGTWLARQADPPPSLPLWPAPEPDAVRRFAAAWRSAAAVA